MRTWKKVSNTSLKNLHVLCAGARELGFIDKPRDTAGCKNMWRSYAGIGEQARFLGHDWKQSAAQSRVEEATQSKSPLSPIMEDYRTLKQELELSSTPNILLMVRLGDFYEFFFKDAETASKILGTALTLRNGTPMTGIPVHAAAHYIPGILAAGHKLVIRTTPDDNLSRQFIQPGVSIRGRQAQ